MSGLLTGGVAPSIRRRPAATSRRRSARDRRTGLLLVVPALALVAVVFVAPLALSVVMSLSDWPLLGERTFVGFDNYTRLFADPQARQAIVFTLGFAAVVTPLTLVAGLVLALLVQHRRRGIGLVRTAVFVPVAIGFASASYLFLALTNSSTGVFGRLLTDLGITERPVDWLLRPRLAMLLVVLVTLWKTVGFAMIALMNGLHSVGRDVEEAARVDGAGALRILLQIKLPMMRDSVAFAATFTAIGAFLAFDQFYILTGGGPSNSTITAVYRIYNTAFIQGQLGYAAAMSLVFLVFLLIVTGAQLALLRRGRVT
ncbi:sugar ABC transporter permease [Jiangella ureilytica]|uniref:Sugar ABC transporter permease n=1 Tax=Jiangella ureilytica TaxID=2530374 RepID=A0A4R4RHK7_9ACTN|nr:sugar ABC transporter permease [Jiangella ureilytica]TDC48042.1 sugar ABC transporter permease [Jiangella ureilytica]